MKLHYFVSSALVATWIIYPELFNTLLNNKAAIWVVLLMQVDTLMVDVGRFCSRQRSTIMERHLFKFYNYVHIQPFHYQLQSIALQKFHPLLRLFSLSRSLSLSHR